MFSSWNKETGAPQAAAAPAAAQPQRRATRSSSAPSIISADLVVTGTLTSSGDIQIDGRVEGNVNTSNLVIGEKALIQGDVAAEEVTVRGRVQGSIRARKVLLASTCHVEGDILHEAFAVETGAFFEGNCRHADNPLANVPGRAKPEAEAAATSSVVTPITTAARTADAPRPAATATFAPLNTGA
jgi:cytoskeletal protein CcmA (bactofilin family)